MEILKIAIAIIVSFGISGFIILALSNWLGKVWANRIMIDEKANHDRDLAKLRADLQNQNERNINTLKTEFDIYRETFLRGHNDKIVIYRQVVDIIADLLTDINTALATGNPLPLEVTLAFERRRLRIYGYLGMLAPQNVMDAYDQMIDYLLSVIIENSNIYQWETVRDLALNMLNQIRSDIGIDTSPIEYRGKR
ncbi:MAG: hypothetical protein FVQ85_17805 [Planctomycetes bacterium]|nr:hypothetical protein [Planctomycetota bacterium]